MSLSPSHVTERRPLPKPLAVAVELVVPPDEAEADADADAFAEPLPLALALAEEELVKNWNAIASLPLNARAIKRQVNAKQLLIMAISF